MRKVTPTAYQRHLLPLPFRNLTLPWGRGLSGLALGTILMQTWYRVDLPLEECCRNGKADQLQKAFEVMFIARGQPKHAALFELHDDKFETNGFYFSPLAATLVGNLIEHFSGVECAPPAVSDRLVLLVGHSAAYEVLRNEQRIREVLSGVHLCPPTS